MLSASCECGLLGRVVGAAAQLMVATIQEPPPQSPKSISCSGCHKGCVLNTVKWTANMKATLRKDSMELLDLKARIREKKEVCKRLTDINFKRLHSCSSEAYSK
ncbi:MAG: hypothetical protein GC192_17075 [Bacteroidetes bacterium]|nr:hypothetical protein [Bacteroidota bacterium]